MNTILVLILRIPEEMFGDSGETPCRGSPMRRTIECLMRDETGSSALEYSLVATLVSIAIIGGVTALGTRLSESYQFVLDKLG